MTAKLAVRFLTPALIALAALVLAACSGDGGADDSQATADLRERIAELEAENEGLRTQVEQNSRDSATADVAELQAQIDHLESNNTQLLALLNEAHQAASTASNASTPSSTTANDAGAAAPAVPVDPDQVVIVANQPEETAPGTVLEVGEWWRQGSVEIQLLNCDTGRACVFSVHNLDPDRTLDVQPNPIHITAEFEEEVVALGFTFSTGACRGQPTAYAFTLDPGASRILFAHNWIRPADRPDELPGTAECVDLQFVAQSQAGLQDVAAAGSDLVVHVSELAGVSNARWLLTLEG